MGNSNELRHWGIKGMKWGVRRYQYKDGSLTPEGKKRYGDDDDSYETEEERLNQYKSKVIKSDSAKTLYENRHLFTTNELQEAYRRLNTEKLIKELQPKEVSKGQKFINAIKKIGDSAKTVSETYSNVQKFRSLFSDEVDATTAKSGDKKKGENQIKDTLDKVMNKSGDSSKKSKGDSSSKNSSSSVSILFGDLGKYAHMDVSSIKSPTYTSQSTIAKYAHMNLDSLTDNFNNRGSISKYAHMNLSSSNSNSTNYYKMKLSDLDDLAGR